MPDHNEFMETNIPGIFVAGDVAGVEEASTAMEEGRLAGIGAAASLGYLNESEREREGKKVWERLDSLRSGPFGAGRKKAKDLILSQEGGIVYDCVV